MEMTDRVLIKFAKDAEDVAAGLHNFRDSLPRSATIITRNISELFAISSILRGIDSAQADAQYAPSFYRLRDDLNLLMPTLKCTMADAFDMFARSRERPYQMVWDDLGHKMENEEGVSLIERLEWYHDFLDAQFKVLKGRHPDDMGNLRRQLLGLRDAQDVSRLRDQRQAIDASASSTPRPGPGRPRPSRLNTPISPTSMSDASWSNYDMPPPFAPEPPAPTSPTFTSSSSHSLSSSQTSYSSDHSAPGPPPIVHWAQSVFDGRNPGTSFLDDFQLADRSSCFGTVDSTALQRLVSDGFVRALELPFDQESFWMRLYFRPSDSRGRILLMRRDAQRREMHFCTPITNLRVIRDESCLQLCKIKKDGAFVPWAKLNFFFYERMVLFYSTFVAMKRQDRTPVPHEELQDSFQLKHAEAGEVQEFGGKVKHGDLRHAVRLYQDLTSGVVRLEASALRGPMKDVPLWTAFVTKYAHDPDWASFEGNGVVSLVAVKPPPYVFLAGYEPPMNRKGEYLLQFTTNDDAQEFIETWTQLCRGR